MADYRDEDMPQELKQQADQLSQVGQSYRGIPVPETIDLYLERGIQDGKRRERRTSARRYSGWTAAALLIVFLLSVRVSPAIATAVSQIPGMDYIVNLVRFDKGLELAVENDFIQPVGLSDEHGGVRLTIDGVIADEHRMVILYNLQSLKDAGLKITDVQVLDADSGEPMQSVSHYPGELQGNIEVLTRQEELVPKRVLVEVGVSIYPEASPDGPPLEPVHDAKLPDRWTGSYPKPDGVWSVAFDVDHEKFLGMQQVYDVNETITVEGQSFTIKQAVVHPIGVSVEIGVDPNNSMEIFTMTGLHLVNEKGEVYDFYARLNDEYYFESPYFAMPDELYLVGERIRAMDKDELEVEIDLDAKQIVRAPDERLQLHDVIVHGDEVELSFRLLQPEYDQNHYHLFSTVHDAAGHSYHVTRSGTSKSSDAPYSEMSIFIPDAEYEGYLSFELHDYPGFIETPFRIQIK